MATTIVTTIKVDNVSNQIVIINVQPLSTSTIFTESGQIAVQPGASLEAEDNRFDLAQLRSMNKNNVIEFMSLRRSVEITGGSSGT